MAKKYSLLFLCTGNACRSQMAEGLCRHYRGAELTVESAGIEKHGLNPKAVKVMAEIGVDISGQSSKTMDELGDREFDYVVTVCDHARETCPYWPAQTRALHQSFDDPPKLAEGTTSEEQALLHYRRVRDEIKAYVLTLPEALAPSAS